MAATWVADCKRLLHEACESARKEGEQGQDSEKGPKRRGRKNSKLSKGKNDDKHAILANWGDSLSRAFLTAAEGEEVGEKEREKGIFLSCASTLLALDRDEVRRDVVSACQRGGIDLLQLLHQVDPCVLDIGEGGSSLPEVRRQMLQYTLMQLLLSMGTKVHGQNHKEICEQMYGTLDSQKEWHIKRAFYGGAKKEAQDNWSGGELMTWCWAHIPQLKENQLGTSRTRGVTGEEIWKERMTELCSEMENQLKNFHKLGQMDLLPFQELQHIVYKCNTICKYMCDLLKCRYTFRPRVSLDKVVSAMESYFSLCQKMCRVRGHKTKASSDQGLIQVSVAQALMSILELQSVLRRACSFSLLLRSETFVKQLNMSAKLSLTKPLLQSELGHTLMNQVMTTILDFVESFKVSFVLKLKPHVIALPCLVLMHISKQRDGEEEKWLNVAGTSFKFLSAIIRCTSLQWPTQQMQVLIATCLLETTQRLVEKLASLEDKRNRKYVKQREDLCILSCESLSLMNQTASVTYAAFRERSIILYRDISDRLAYLPHLKSCCDSILHGLQSSLRTLCVAKWNIVETSDVPVLTFEGLPDVLQTMFKENESIENKEEEAAVVSSKAVRMETDAPKMTNPSNPLEMEGLKRVREEDQSEDTKKEERNDRNMTDSASDARRVTANVAKKQKETNEEIKSEESRPKGAATSPGPVPKPKQQPASSYLDHLPPKPKGLSANYEDLSSDSEGEALSLDSGLGDD